MSAELIDPFASDHQPVLTPEEWVDIRNAIREYTFGDPSLIPDCFTEAVKVLGEIGTSNTPNPARAATQCLRRLAYRAKTGVPFHEPQEPAWSLDTSDRESLIDQDDLLPLVKVLIEDARQKATIDALEDAADAIIVPGASSLAAAWLRDRARLLAQKAAES